MVVVTCFRSDRYHPAYCTSVASSSLVVNGWLMILMLMDDDMAMEVQTINSIRHKILTPFDFDSLIADTFRNTVLSPTHW